MERGVVKYVLRGLISKARVGLDLGLQALWKGDTRERVESASRKQRC